MDTYIIRFADLWLKGINKKDFINSLFSNIKKALYDFDILILKKHDYFEISINKANEKEEIINILKFIPGISYIVESKIMEDTNIYNIPSFIVNEIKNRNLEKQQYTFKVEVKRYIKNIMDSYSIKVLVADEILKNTNFTVDVKTPSITFFVFIEKNKIYISFKKIKGINGMPIGLNGSTLSLISGGIDSAISSFMMQNRGLEVNYITFIEKHNEDKILLKLKKIINKITLNNRIYKPKFFFVYFDSVQQELAHASNTNYRIILMRRSFYRIAIEIAKNNNISSLTSGDSLGQVASQTIESLITVNTPNNFLVFRPLIGLDKNFIIKIARQIDTYDLSIESSSDICTNFNPKNPVTKPNLKKAEEIENSLFLLKDLEWNLIDTYKKEEM